MKRIFGFFFTIVLVIGLFGSLPAYANGSLNASASATTVTIGNEVTITLKYSSPSDIGAIDAHISYNDAAFEYVSYQDAANSGGVGAAVGGGGVVTVSWYANGATAPASTSFSIKFKAKAAGAGNFSISTPGFTNDSNVSLGNPSGTLSVSAMNPTLSANANLASIKPSSGTLTPKFSAGVTNYTITVPYTTTSLSLSATAQDAGAKIAVSGKNALAVGKNTQVITVTAPNGATKNYTVVITRSADQATTTTTAPQEDPLEVEVDGVLMTVSDTQADATLPEGFSWTHITINDVTVSAAVNEKTHITLTYLANPQTESGAFYIYDETSEKFSLFCPLKVNGGEYVLLDTPAGFVPPTGAVANKHTFGTIERNVYTFEDAALEDILLVYATSPEGKTGLYVYDTTDGSMQLYREFTVSVDAEPTEPEPTNPFIRFVMQNRQIILICAAALGGIALLIGAIVLLLITTRKDKGCKH